jgi:hypothetical protein
MEQFGSYLSDVELLERYARGGFVTWFSVQPLNLDKKRVFVNNCTNAARTAA